MQQFTLGTTPKQVILDQLDADKDIAEQGGYRMTLRGYDAHIFRTLVNKGIDAHLEAIFFEEEPLVGGSTISCVVKPESVPVLLRRLWEAYESGPTQSELEELPFDADVFQEEAISLRSAILSTLDIEEV